MHRDRRSLTRRRPCRRRSDGSSRSVGPWVRRASCKNNNDRDQGNLTDPRCLMRARSRPRALIFQVTKRKNERTNAYKDSPTPYLVVFVVVHISSGSTTLHALPTGHEPLSQCITKNSKTQTSGVCWTAQVPPLRLSFSLCATRATLPMPATSRGRLPATPPTPLRRSRALQGRVK